ncbi:MULTISPECIES: hypothetical protein [unclassified Streptomyces]|uniref:hypothetical protein n=1 Tax=unclassified Streptomyces TaxID=2593676 RepID=UPI00332D5D88
MVEALDVVTEGFDVVAEVFDVVAAVFVRGAADGLAVRSEDWEDWEDDTEDATGDSDRTGEGDVAGDREGCAGIPIAGASACTPIRLLPMATARIAPTTETGQPKPRNRRPRTPDWSTNTGAGANSSKLDSDMSDCAWRADPRSMEMPTGRTLRGLSLQGT